MWNRSRQRESRLLAEEIRGDFRYKEVDYSLLPFQGFVYGKVISMPLALTVDCQRLFCSPVSVTPIGEHALM